MEQSLHLLIVDLWRGRALAVWHGDRWRLPILTTPERVRAYQPVNGWAASIGLRVRMLGQWLGRLAPAAESIDWLAVAQSDGEVSILESMGLCWRTFAELTTSTSWVEYQQWAVSQASSGGKLPGVPGPFGRASWLDDTTSWVEQVLALPVKSITPYRATAYEVAVRFTTDRRQVYFKGLSVDRADEAPLTVALHSFAPDTFARTLALRAQRDGAVWWLTEECPGESLADRPTVENATRVVAACGRLQRDVRARLDETVGRIPRVDMRALGRWGSRLLDTEASRGCETSSRLLEEVCSKVAAADVPEGLIPVDLDASNVFLDGDQVRLIDLEQLHYGPAPLAAAMFVRKVARAMGRHGMSPEARAAVLRAYETSWSPPLHMKELWPAFVTMAGLFEAHLGWMRVQRKLSRGEVHGMERCVRTTIARRLAAIVAG